MEFYKHFKTIKNKNKQQILNYNGSSGEITACDKNNNVWREDSGLLTDKTKLPVKQLRFGDAGNSGNQGYHTLGKLECYGSS